MADRRSLLDHDDYDDDDGGRERRRSVREAMNVFDDEFAVDDFDVVADGFRPGRRSRDSADTARPDHDRDAIITVAAHYASQPVTPTGGGPSRSSTRKSRSYANPFASPEDEAEAPLRRTPSGNFTADMARRSVSSASSNVYAGTHSPRMAPGGPSHPYGMYPQGTMARTPSVATQSTVRPQRNLSVRGGPAHPYAMYPQGVGDDLEDDEDAAPQNLVPVGFPGLGQSYQRRMGPEGEDQDLIGDFGHTEQLPPYSRYPEDGPEKPLLGVPDPPTALHSRAPVQGSDPGNPLMHTHLQPQQARQSMSDESTLRRQPSMASRRSLMPVLEPTSSHDTLMSEKKWSEKTWQQRRRTKMLCGIPFIWLAISLASLLFIVALVGGVIGGYVVGKSKGTKSAEEADESSMYDASLIAATPTAVPLPTGTFALQFGPPEEPEDSCLVAASQAAAWSCEFGGDPNTMIDIGGAPFNNLTGAFLYPGIVPTNELLYGLQVDSLATQFEPFLLVSDRDDPGNGHAYYFQTTYDKVVVIPGDALQGGVSSGKIKRGYSDDGAWSVEKHVAEIGDKPWFCYWNATSVEGFIYADRPIFSTTTPAATLASPTMSSVSNYSAKAAVYSGSWPASSPAYPTPPPEMTITTTFDMMTATPTYEGPVSALPSWLHENYPEYTPAPWLRYHDEDDDDDDDDGFARRRKRDDDDDDDDDDDADYSWMSGQSVPVFPYLVKIEERRKQGAPPPYCQQYQLLNDGTWNWIPDPDDDSRPITVKLDESVPSYNTYNPSQQRRRKRSPDGACHCQWMSGLKGS